MSNNKLVTCLWFDHGEGRRAVKFYAMRKIDIARIEAAIAGETADA